MTNLPFTWEFGQRWGQWVGCSEFGDIIWLEWESKAQTIKDRREGFAHSVCWESRHFVLVYVSGGGRIVESDSGRMPNVVVYLYLLNAYSRKGGFKRKGWGKGGPSEFAPAVKPLWTGLAAENVGLLPPRKGRAEEGRVHTGVRQASCCQRSAYTCHPSDRWLHCCSDSGSCWAEHCVPTSCSARLFSAPRSLGSRCCTSHLTTQRHPAFVVSYFFILATGPWLSSASAFQGWWIAPPAVTELIFCSTDV